MNAHLSFRVLVLLSFMTVRYGFSADSPQPASASELPSGAVTSSASTPLTRSATEIVKMQAAGIEKGVIQAFILSAKTPYKATAEDILYLHDNKVSDDLVREWVQKGNELNGAPSVAAHSPDLIAHSPDPASPAQPAPMIQEAAPAAAPSVVYQNPPTVVTSPSVVYSYGYSYPYPYYYSSPISLGFYWGGGPYYYHGGHYYYHGGYGGHGYSGGGHGGYGGHGGGHH